MTTLLSHTSALEALRRLGCIRQESICPDAVAYGCATDPSEAIAHWESAFHDAPRLPLHVQVPQDAQRVRSSLLVTHPMREPPNDGILSLGDGLACLAPAQLLVQMEPHLTRLEILMLMDELMGTYAVRTDVAQGMTTRPSPLLSPNDLASFLEGAGGTSSHRKLRWALKWTTPGSASPRESKLAIRLSLRPSAGGYGLAVVGLNREVSVSAIASGKERIRRPDVLLARPGDLGSDRVVALEYDGEVHLDEGRRADDQRRTNELAAMGIAEYRIDKALYRNLAYMDSLVDQIRAELGMPREHLSRGQREDRRKLRTKLFDELEQIDGVNWNGLSRERQRREERAAATEAREPVPEEIVPLEAYGV